MVMYYNSGIRQMIAMALYVFAFYQFLPKRNYIGYYLVCIFALLFHESAIFALVIPLLFFVEKRWMSSPKKLAIVVGITMAIFMGVIYIGFPIFYQYYFWLPRMGRIASYFLNKSFSILGIGMEVCWFGVVLLLHTLAKENTDEFDRFQLLVWGLSFILYVSFIRYPLASRFCDFIQAILIIYIPNLVHKIPESKKQLLGYSTVIALNAILLFGDLHFTTNHIKGSPAEVPVEHMNIPYLTVFQANQIQQYYHYYLD